MYMQTRIAAGEDTHGHDAVPQSYRACKGTHMSMVEIIRRWNRARLERRELRKRAGEARAGGLVVRLVGPVRTWNRERIARRRQPGELLASLAANDTAALEALVFLLQSARQGREASEAGLAALTERLSDSTASLSERLSRVDGTVEALRITLAKGLVPLAQQSAASGRDGGDPALGLAVPGERPHLIVEETGRQDLVSPELDLFAYLAPLLPSRTALDIGANVGDVSHALLAAGLTVHAFEPAPATFARLMERLGPVPEFSGHAIALGPSDGSAELRLASDASNVAYGDPSQYSTLLPQAGLEDLPFTETVSVPMRSLESLHQANEIPANVGLVKIDTEGFDLEVIRGMGDRTYPLVVAEFWDPECEFGRKGALNRLDEIVPEMRRRGYPWHLVIYRVWGRDEVAWYCNRSASVERSWGNAFFFRDRRLFGEARRWCASVLPGASFVLKRRSAGGV
jgi:FkbM family methyltransferase